MRISGEENYIRKRRRKAFWEGIPFYICRVFPIKKYKVVMWTYEGNRGYCCNPRYVAEELLRQDADYEIIWLVNDMSTAFPKGIRKVKNTLWRRAYHLSTAGAWVGNTRTFFGTKKRKGQIYIQTWHGSMCIKAIGKYRGELFPRIAEIVSKADSRLIDYVLSNSSWWDSHLKDGLLYEGRVVRTGLPRCDVFFRDREAIGKQIRNLYKLPSDARILLYAPTFRGGSQSTNRSVSGEEITLDVAGLLGVLEYRFGEDWYIFMRLHPQLAAQNEACRTMESERVVDVTQYQEMNELIAASDVFITDYSSAVFEAMLTEIPCFVYADDLEDYVRDRGDLFFDLKTLPFALAQNNEEMFTNIQNHETDSYLERVRGFMEKYDITEDGKAAARVAELLTRK